MSSSTQVYQTSLRFAVDALAVYRLTKLIKDDVITLKMREAYWKKFPRNTTMGYLLTCDWCVSIWAAAMIISAKQIAPKGADIVTFILATSALTGIAAEKGI